MTVTAMLVDCLVVTMLRRRQHGTGQHDAARESHSRIMKLVPHVFPRHLQSPQFPQLLPSLEDPTEWFGNSGGERTVTSDAADGPGDICGGGGGPDGGGRRTRG